MEVDYIMLVQNYVYYDTLSKNNHMVVVQWLKTWLLNVEVKSSSPYTYILGYLGYFGDLIR